jgi:hypothetical protein
MARPKSNAPVSDLSVGKTITSPSKEQRKGSDPISTKSKGK